VAGKTGTTSDSRDAWFAGYTPDLVAVVWVAHENRLRRGGRLQITYSPMPGATGGHLCAPIWRDFMLKALPIQQAANRPPVRAAAKTSEEEKQKEGEPREKRQEGRSQRGQAEQDTTRGEEASAETPGPEPRTTGAPTLPPAPTPSLPPPGGAVPAVSPATGPAPSPAEGPETRREPVAAPHMSEPAGRLATPNRPRRDPEEELVTVRLCADSMRRATQWCQVTVERRMRRRDIPGRCRVHRAPPGEME